jgi:hypothetical protein
MGAMLIAGVAIGMAGQQLRSADAEPPPAGPAVETNVPVSYSRDEDGHLRAELDRLAEQVRALAREKREPAAPAAAATATPERRSAHESAIAREDALLEGEARQQAEEQKIAEQFASEPVDPRWNALDQVTPKLKNALPAGSSVQNVDCKSTLCRIDTTHVSAETYASYVDHYLLSDKRAPEERVWPGSARFVTNGNLEEDGPVSSTIFLLREDHEFPELR